MSACEGVGLPEVGDPADRDPAVRLGSLEVAVAHVQTDDEVAARDEGSGEGVQESFIWLVDLRYAEDVVDV